MRWRSLPHLRILPRRTHQVSNEFEKSIFLRIFFLKKKFKERFKMIHRETFFVKTRLRYLLFALPCFSLSFPLSSAADLKSTSDLSLYALSEMSLLACADKRDEHLLEVRLGTSKDQGVILLFNTRKETPHIIKIAVREKGKIFVSFLSYSLSLFPFSFAFLTLSFPFFRPFLLSFLLLVTSLMFLSLC